MIELPSTYVFQLRNAAEKERIVANGEFLDVLIKSVFMNIQLLAGLKGRDDSISEEVRSSAEDTIVLVSMMVAPRFTENVLFHHPVSERRSVSCF